MRKETDLAKVKGRSSLATSLRNQMIWPGGAGKWENRSAKRIRLSINFCGLLGEAVCIGGANKTREVVEDEE